MSFRDSYTNDHGQSSESLSKQTKIERHQSMASVMSTDTVLSSQRLLDRLDMDDDLPWASKGSPQFNFQQSRQNSVHGLINGSYSSNQASKSSLSSFRNSIRRKRDTFTEDESAIKTAQALGSKVNEVKTNTSVVVGHVNIDENFNSATVEVNDVEDYDVETKKPSVMVTPRLISQDDQIPRRTSVSPQIREDPNELRVKKAMQLRRHNPKEAAYQLSIAAHHGSRLAMFLYGLALWDGEGLRMDKRQSFTWFCKAATFDPALDANHNFEIDPFDLSETTIPKVPPEPEAKAFLMIGLAYLNGEGVEKNENRALQFLEKSASLGNVEAMSQAGLLWQNKGHNRKKDSHRSAAWLRFARSRGANNYGTSWIDKEKYMKRK